MVGVAKLRDREIGVVLLEILPPPLLDLPTTHHQHLRLVPPIPPMTRGRLWPIGDGVVRDHGLEIDGVLHDATVEVAVLYLLSSLEPVQVPWIVLSVIGGLPVFGVDAIVSKLETACLGLVRVTHRLLRNIRVIDCLQGGGSRGKWRPLCGALA
jgi:hypothetical protein